jgi:hypothetical protein
VDSLGGFTRPGYARRTAWKANPESANLCADRTRQATEQWRRPRQGESGNARSGHRFLFSLTGTRPQRGGRRGAHKRGGQVYTRQRKDHRARGRSSAKLTWRPRGQSDGARTVCSRWYGRIEYQRSPGNRTARSSRACGQERLQSTPSHLRVRLGTGQVTFSRNGVTWRTKTRRRADGNGNPVPHHRGHVSAPFHWPSLISVCVLGWLAAR